MTDADRTARCRCGQLSLRCAGEPVRVSVCHCANCQRRSGSSYAAQARFPVAAVTITGEARVWEGAGDTGTVAAFHFCPTCGSPVFYRSAAEPGMVAVAVGAFADGAFPPPDYSVYEDRKHAWVTITDPGTEHYD